MSLSGLSGLSGLGGLVVSAGGAAITDPPDFSVDYTDPLAQASMSRAGAAGYTTTGDSAAFQREAAADTLRNHLGGIILENTPTVCTLVAPGTPSVTPGEQKFSATSTGIPVTASLLKVQYRVDGGSAVDNPAGASFTLTDITETAGDHTVSMRGVSTSGVAGEWSAESASFTVTGVEGTPIQGDYLNEGFETASTGYEESGWNTATDSPNAAYDISALTTNKPNGSGSQGFRSNFATDGVYPRNSWNSGADRSSAVYVRFYVYIVSHSIANGQFAFIGGVFTNGSSMTAGVRNCRVVLENDSGTLKISAEGSAKVAVSTGQWILVELKLTPNGVTNGSAIKVNGGSANTFTDTGYGTWRAIGVGVFGSTNDTFSHCDLVFDLLAADSTGYIGGTP